MPGRHRVVRELGCRELEIERARPGDVDRPFDRTGPAREPAHLLGRRAQVRERRGREPTVDLVEGTAGAHRRECGRQRPARGGRVVDVVRRDHLDARAQRDLHERIVAVPVERIAVVPQLDEHTVAAERVHQLAHRAFGGESDRRAATRPAPCPCGIRCATNHASFSRLVVSPLRKTGARAASANTASDERGRALLPRQLRGADRTRQPRVPDRPLREHEQVLAGRIRHPVREPPRRVERELRTEHRGQADFARGFGEAHHAVEPVVIGERERGQPEPRRFFDQLFGMARPVEEREIRMTVQLGIRHADAGCEHVHACHPSPPRKRHGSEHMFACPRVPTAP